jgi:8-hydroxy-5-deazaflavin:NADPH oxidoreductase
VIKFEEVEIKTIGILGGTGKEGKGLAYRWGKAGYDIIIGSRDIEKAKKAAFEVNKLITDTDNNIDGLINSEAAQKADLIVITVPFAVHEEMILSIRPFVQGKIVIDVTVPLVPPKVTKVQMPPEGSASQQAKRILGEGVEIVTAFQNISYENLLSDNDVECDVLVCGTSNAAREVVLELIKSAGLIGWNAGPIENAVVVEGLTSILIGINKQYGVEAAGIKITGVAH